ncbi:MAG: hypothetical protein HYX46_02655 [Betaproteobacteria bacterium]|nr:hypothetical protein [Betaproteobacteria bacterium]
MGATRILAADAALDDAKAQEFLKKGGCALCHGVDKKDIGPAFKDVAQKRKGEAFGTLENAVRSGSGECWHEPD